MNSQNYIIILYKYLIYIMFILHIINSLEIGGAQKILYELATRQQDTGHKVWVLVYRLHKTDIETNLVKKGIKVISLEAKNIYSLSNLTKIRYYLHVPDIVHVHLFPSLYHVALASFGIKTPIIYTEHSTYNRRRSKKLLAPIERFIYKRYTRIISISNATHNALIKWLGIKDDNRFTIIHNGIDIAKFATTIDNNQEKIFGRTGKPILMVSRFVPSKDQETLIKSLKFIDDNSVFLVFAGEGETMEQCKELASVLNLTERCLFLGNRNDIPILINSCCIGVQSSNWEGFGLTAIEFMTNKKPIIASNIPGLSEIVSGAGLLFPKGDAKELGTLINKLISDQDYYHQITQSCYERSLNFDISETNIDYLNIYKKVIN